METFLGLLLTLLTAVSMVTHSRQETIEQVTFTFNYDPNLHVLVGNNYGKCYIAPLTRQESDSVHTDRGMEELEIAMMRDWIGVYPEINIHHDDPALNNNLRNWCNRRIMYYIQRPIGVTTAMPSTTHAQTSTSVPKSTSLPLLFTRAPLTSLTQTLISATSTQNVVPTGSHPADYIFYIQGTPMKAVLVTSQTCYVYTMTDIESMMIMTGDDLKPVFENTLSSRDRTSMKPYTDQDPAITRQIKQHCPNTVLQFY